MSSATEDANHIRNLIKELFGYAGEGDFKPEDAHNFEDDDCELFRDRHALYAYQMLSRLPGGLVSQDSG